MVASHDRAEVHEVRGSSLDAASVRSSVRYAVAARRDPRYGLGGAVARNPRA
jgi:hypothetical protein